MRIIEVDNKVLFVTEIDHISQVVLAIERIAGVQSVESFKKLKHTKTIVNYLFRLVLAYSSERTMLIEGEFCSSKTSLAL